jgi:hypothetical protein
MGAVDNVVRIPIGGGGGEEDARGGGAAAPASSPPPDLLTVAARAAVGLVALAVESAVQILRRVSGTPAGTPSDEDGLALVTGAAMGFTIEAVRTGLSIAQLGLRIAGPPTTFVVDTFLDAPRRAGEDLAGEWNERWREERPEVEAAATAVAVEVTRQAVELVLDQLDLTQLVLDHVDLGRVIDAVDIDAVVDKLDLDAIVQRVDLDRVAEGIDLDAVAERLDVERVVARLDLAKLSLEVIDRIDLPEIIRSSTGTVANEGVRVIRMQTFGADRAITGLVQRMLGRRPPAVAEEMAEEIAEDPERRGD